MAVWIKDKVGSGGDISALETKVNDLDTKITSVATTTLKTNQRDQQTTGLKVTDPIDDDMSVLRRIDVKYVNLTNFTGTIQPNTDSTFTMSEEQIKTGKKYDIIVTFTAAGVTYTTKYFLDYTTVSNVNFPISTFPQGAGLSAANDIILKMRFNVGRQFFLRPNVSIANIKIYKREVFI